MKKIDFSDRMEAEKYFCGVVEQMPIMPAT